MSWTINFWDEDILFKTEKAIKLMIPHTAYATWVPKALVKSAHADHYTEFTAIIFEEMNFGIYLKHSKVCVVAAEKINDLFNNSVNSRTVLRALKEIKHKSEENNNGEYSIIREGVHHTPAHINPIKRDVEDEFKR